MKKIINIKNIPGLKKTTGDTLKDKRRLLKHQNGKNTELLDEFKEAWENLEPLRSERARNYRYTYEDQWSDLVEDDNGELVTERERISRRTGGVVLQNNHLITIPTTLTGLYTKSATIPTVYARTPKCDDKADMMSNALQANWKRTGERELMTDRFLDLSVGGIAAVVEEWSVHEGVEDSYTFPVNVDYLAWKSRGNDPRGWDMYMVGEIRDSTLDSLASEIGASKEDYDQLNALYEPFRNMSSDHSTDRAEIYETMSFEKPTNTQLCRTYRIWTQESRIRLRCVDIEDREEPLYKVELSDKPKIDAINAQRHKLNNERIRLAQSEGIPDGAYQLLELIKYEQIWDQYWHFWMLAPDGTILEDYDSPYEHGSHPYTIRAYNYVRGKVVPFISPVIDQQRYINRLITLYDLAVNTSIKGLHMIPKSCVPDYMTNEEFAKKSVELGGWVFYDDEASDKKPEYITQNSIPVGVADLLQMQVNWVKDISNVSGALQGQQPQSGTAFARYALETENSTTSLAALISKFAYFETDVARKKLKTIHQYYQEPRNISNQHSTYASYALYEPKLVQDIDFDVNICETADTPTARAALNEFTQMLWEKGQIGLENFINRINLPGKDGILQDIKANAQVQQNAYQQAQQGGQVNGNIQPYMNKGTQQQIGQQSNPKAVNALRQALTVA